MAVLLVLTVNSDLPILADTAADLARLSLIADFAPGALFSGAIYWVMETNFLRSTLQVFLRSCPIMWKHDVIHKTRSIWDIALFSEEDQVTATGNKYRKFCKIWMCGVWEMQADRETDPHTNTLITILRLSSGVNVTQRAQTSTDSLLPPQQVGGKCFDQRLSTCVCLSVCLLAK